ncbi:hypothetical protein SynBIOSU31_01734 [Synechococcus sp. BIOS-U3-1]|nr:hypothetical protein SynBIOSU31_01734 [Synechococcus sp. BIOS-U3-1]
MIESNQALGVMPQSNTCALIKESENFVLVDWHKHSNDNT